MKRLLLLFLLVASMAQGAAVSLFPPGFVVLDNSGQPVSGAKCYTYTGGTTNNKTTWADSGKSTPNTNPVIADAYGRLTVFAEGVYKIVLKDASDVTLVTLDNLVMADPTALTTGSFGTLTVTAATIGSATIANLSATNPTLSNPTTSNGNLNTPTITNPTINGGTISSATISMNGSFNFNSQKGVNLASPTAAGDAVNLGYLDTVLGSRTIQMPFSYGADTTSEGYDEFYLTGGSSWTDVKSIGTVNNPLASYTTVYHMTCNGTLVMSGTTASLTSIICEAEIALMDGDGNVYAYTKPMWGVPAGVTTAANSWTNAVPFSLSANIPLAPGQSKLIALKSKNRAGSVYLRLLNGARWVTYSGNTY